MRTMTAIVFAFLTVCGLSAAAQAAPPDPTGYWVTGKDEAVVQIYDCGEGHLCGALVGFPMDTPDSAPPRTWDHKSQCRFVFIRGLHARTRAWQGSIINPQNGHGYSAKIRLMSHDELRLRGYLFVPMLGQTRFWTRYNGTPPPVDCRLPAHALG